MNWMPQGLGAEPKKIAILGVLVVLLGAGYWYTHSGDDSGGAAAPPAAKQAKSTAIENVPDVPMPPTRTQTPSIARSTPGGPRSARGGNRPTEDFRPSLKPQEGVDLTTVDPTIHLELLAKLRDLPMEGGTRSVFKEGAPPPPPPPAVTVKPSAMIVGPQLPPKTPEQIAKEAGPPPKPPPPPIPLQFYGYVNQQHKRAFFIEGEDIFVAGENDLVKNRYKIVRIGVNSAVVEDTTDKHQQTLPLVKELDG